MFFSPLDYFVFYAVDSLIGLILAGVGGVRIAVWHKRKESPDRAIELVRMIRFLCLYVLIKGAIGTLWFIASLFN
jgi:hypothetical protein